MGPIWAVVVAGIAIVFLGVDFWLDKRKWEKRERQSRYGIGQIQPPTNAYYGGKIAPTNEPVDINSAYPPELPMPEPYERNIHAPIERGNEPQAYYRMHGDVYILPLRSYEWETVRYALNTMPPKGMYIGDKNVILTRMENVDKL